MSDPDNTSAAQNRQQPSGGSGGGSLAGPSPATPRDDTADSMGGRPPPQDSEAAFGQLQAEILGELAASLEYAGEQLKRSLAALGIAAPGSARTEALETARAAFWNLIVQRDACGFRNPDDVVAAFAVPPEVRQAVLPPPLVPRKQWT